MILETILGTLLIGGLAKLKYGSKKSDFERKNPDSQYTGQDFVNDMRGDAQKKREELEKRYNATKK